MQTDISPCVGQVRFKKTRAGVPSMRQTSAGQVKYDKPGTGFWCV